MLMRGVLLRRFSACPSVYAFIPETNESLNGHRCRYNGLDAYLFVRFIKLMLWIFAPIALVSWAVVSLFLFHVVLACAETSIFPVATTLVRSVSCPNLFFPNWCRSIIAPSRVWNSIRRTDSAQSLHLWK